MKIAVYTIAKNEAQFAARWAASAADADCRLVVDTGSTDDTVAACRAAGVTVAEICVAPWRFDDARNAALALLPADIDVCISLDMDEVLAPGWRASLEAGWTPATTTARYYFTWSHHADGSPAVRYLYDKIHARRGYRWRHPCHESLYADPRIAECVTFIADLEIHHWPDPTKSRGQYLDLLQLAAAESPHDARTAHYLAREFYFYNRHAEAEAEFRRHLQLKTATWPAERCASLRYLAKIAHAAGDHRRAITWLHQAAETCPEIRDPWVDLAHGYYTVADWRRCADAVDRALAIAEEPAAYMNDPRSYSEFPHDLAAMAAYRLGAFAAALAHGRAAVARAPDDARLVGNLSFYEAAAGAGA